MNGADQTGGRSAVHTIELVSGALCLDFANTVEGREGPERRDLIRHRGDLVTWGRRAGGLGEREGEATLDGQASMDGILSFREVIYRIFSAIARSEEPGPQDLDELRDAYADAMRHARLRQGRHPAVWTWGWNVEGHAGALDVLGWRVAGSAIDLLRSSQLGRLKQCPGGGETPCNWLFLDMTKGGNRKWCSMADCGGRAKWRRQNERRRKRRPD